MKTSKIFIVFTILLATLVGLSNTVSASTSFSLKINSTKTSYSKGDTVTVNIDLYNVTEQSGIAGYQAKLSYDSNVLTLDSVTASEEWEVMQNEGAIVANTKDAMGTKTGTTAVAKFKVNENTTASSTTIKMSNIKGTSGDLETVEGNSVELKITIKSSSNSGSSNSGSSNSGSSNSGSSNSGSSNSGSSNSGSSNSGSSNSGSSNSGSSNSGSSNSGSSNSGSSNSGSNNSGSNNSGSSNSGSSNGNTNNKPSNSQTTNKGNNTTSGNKIPYAGAESVIGIVAVVAIIGIVSYVKYRKTF